MLVEVARAEEVGSSGYVSLSEKVVLVLLAVDASVVKEGSKFLPQGGCLKRDRDLTLAVVAKADSGSCCQGGCRLLKQVKGASTSLRV